MELGGYHERCGGDQGRSQGDAAVRVRELRVRSSNVTDQAIQWRIEMTDRLIVATFNDTNSAYDAASAIKNLKDSGLTEFKLKAGEINGSAELGVAAQTRRDPGLPSERRR